MKSILVGIIIICLTVSSHQLSAQGRKGQIQGYIKDAQTGEVLPFATVMIKGTTIGCVTDDKGFYRINLVSAGRLNLNVSYIGYKDATIVIDMHENETIMQDVNLSSGEELDEVVITGQARGQVKAINTQLTAKTIKNVVSEQKIRELPDANAAEALARLPGVSVHRQGGEAVGVNIRGVNANTVYVNGMRMDGGLGSISSSMIGGIELSKAFMPDQDADILGGSVDFKMREAPSGFKKEIWFRTGYNDFTKSFKMQDASALLSNRFFKDRLGVMLSLSYDRKDRGRDSYDASYESVGSSKNSEELLPVQLSGVTLNQSRNLNNRYGLTIFSDYKFKNGKIYYQGFFNMLKSDNASVTNAYSNSAPIEYGSTAYSGYEGNNLNGIGGEYTLFGVKIDWGVSSSKSKSETKNRFSYQAINRSGMTGVNSIDSLTTINEFMALGTNDITKTFVDRIYKSSGERFANEFGYRINFEVPYHLGDIINGFVRLGGKVRDIKRGDTSNFANGDFNDDSAMKLWKEAVKRLPDYGWTYTPNGYLGHQGFSSNQQVQDFSMLNAKIYFAPDFDKVSYVSGVLIDKFGQTLSSNVDDYSNNEQFYATYIMSEINIGKRITFTPGIRYEKNKYETTAKWLIQTINYGPLANQGEMRDTTNGYHNEHFFPMIHLKIKPTKWSDIRLAYTKTVSRPGFDKMSPKYYRTDAFDIIKGDVFLKPQSNTNYDIYLSVYKNKLGLFTAGAFYKVMENQVLDYSVRILNPADYGLPAAYKNKTLSYPLNNQWSGYIKGLEFDWQTQFSYMPKPFNGLLLNANVTFMQSNTRYPFFSFTTVTIDKPPYKVTEGKNDSRNNTVVGMPDLIANLSVGYELGGFSGRISTYYQGSTITTSQATNLTLDVDRSAVLRLDLQLSQKIKRIEGLSLYLNINNLTNNPDKEVLTYRPDHIISEERYGISGDVGVRYQF